MRAVEEAIGPGIACGEGRYKRPPRPAGGRGARGSRAPATGLHPLPGRGAGRSPEPETGASSGPMTYLTFHLVFILPPIVALGVAARGLLRGRRTALAVLGVPVLALLWTTPWDNYLVWRGVWDYGPDRVVATLGYVPVEEYLFFLLQPLLTGLWLLILVRRRSAPSSPGGPGVRWAGTLAYAALTVAGVVALGHTAGTYMGLILVWSAPVLALQWAWAGGEIWRRRRAAAWGVAVPTLWLWIADATAIHLGVWTISERYTTGWMLGPLPVEEALFFLVTNALVVQGVLLFLHPPRPAPAGARPAEAAA